MMELNSDPRPRALIVDDEPLIRMYAADLLDSVGFRTFQSCNADEALSILRVHHASIMLLFTDVQMPGALDGFALARATSSQWPHISVLVASGAASPVAEQLPVGARFMSKPINAIQIEHYLITLLRNCETATHTAM